MRQDQNILRRAFELAKTGQVRTVEDIRRKLTAEGFDGAHSHLAGPSVAKQLKGLIAQRIKSGS